MSEPYAIYVCLECGEQSRGPAGHHVGGDDICSRGPHGEGSPSQPRLARIAVRVTDEGTNSHLQRARRRTEKLSDSRRAGRAETSGDE